MYELAYGQFIFQNDFLCQFIFKVASNWPDPYLLKVAVDFVLCITFNNNHKFTKSCKTDSDWSINHKRQQTFVRMDCATKSLECLCGWLTKFIVIKTEIFHLHCKSFHCIIFKSVKLGKGNEMTFTCKVDFQWRIFGLYINTHKIFIT